MASALPPSTRPLTQLIPLSFISKEAQHIEGFAPELAIVTKGGSPGSCYHPPTDLHHDGYI